MEKQDILNILDSLDLQIAMGKIDLTTYNTLKEKWTKQLRIQETGTAGDTPVPSSLQQLAPSTPTSYPSTGPIQHTTLIDVLACPKCGAPAEFNSATQDMTKPIRCLFCDTVYMLRQSQDNLQNIKQDIKSWLDQMIVGSGYGDTNSIDLNARRFIFNESLYPSLKKDIDHNLETFEGVIELPMVQVKETQSFRDYQPNPRLLAIARGNNQWLLSLSNRISAPQLQDFAVVSDDKLKLKQYKLRIMSLIYYANIAQHLATPSASSYQVVRQNLLALQKDYKEHMQDITDAPYRSYIAALEARAVANIRLLDVFVVTLGDGRGIDPEAILKQLEQAITQLQQVHQQAFACTYSPLYTVPLQQGIYKDIVGAQIFQAVVKAYQVVNATRPGEFVAFYERLMGYARGLATVVSADHLLWLLRSVGRVLMARAGISPIPALMDWNWLNQAVENNRHKTTFGLGSETGEVLNRHFHPYWVARLNYTEIGGVFGKKGITREGLILVDATSIVNPDVALLLNSDPALPAVQAGTTNHNFLDKQLVSLPALLTHDMAERALKAYTSQHQAELMVPIVRMIGVIYIPAAMVCYVMKNKNRELIVGPLSAINQNLHTVFVQTQQFLQQYGV